MVAIKVRLTILQGRGLAPKDRNLLGKHTTSDPYVEIWVDGDKKGVTKTVGKTLDPVWNNEMFELIIDGENTPDILLKIWDEDRNSDPDAMGTVTLKIPCEKIDTTEWYEIPKDSARNAKGDVQVRVQTLVSKPRKKKNKAKSSMMMPPPKAKANPKRHDQSPPNERTKMVVDLVLLLEVTRVMRAHPKSRVAPRRRSLLLPVVGRNCQNSRFMHSRTSRPPIWIRYPKTKLSDWKKKSTT